MNDPYLWALAMQNLLLLTDADGGLTTYAYDGSNRLSNIVNPFAETTTLTYDALDRELVKTLGNGMQHQHTYDPAGRETLLRIPKADGTALAAFTSTYDPVGNRLTSEELDGVRVTYAYDGAYQLVNEQRSGANAYSTTYVYDSDGNRTLKNDSGQLTTSTYNVSDQLVTATTPAGVLTPVTRVPSRRSPVAGAPVRRVTRVSRSPARILSAVARRIASGWITERLSHQALPTRSETPRPAIRNRRMPGRNCARPTKPRSRGRPVSP